MGSMRERLQSRLCEAAMEQASSEFSVSAATFSLIKTVYFAGIEYGEPGRY